MHVSRVKLRNFRNYERIEVELGDGLTVVHGPVGAGKTNLLEGVYFGCVGRSCRGAAERELVRFGEHIALVCVTASNGSEPHSFEVALERGGPKVTRVDGARSERIAELAERPLLCVFMPDRLELVKGAAGFRRAHLDALVSALWPSRRATRAAYGRALAQRNALLSRVRAGRSSSDALAGWNRELARHGVALVRDRAAAARAIVGGVQARGADLGLGDEIHLHYKPRIEARKNGIKLFQLGHFDRIDPVRFESVREAPEPGQMELGPPNRIGNQRARPHDECPVARLREQKLATRLSQRPPHE